MEKAGSKGDADARDPRLKRQERRAEAKEKVCPPLAGGGMACLQR